MMTGAVLNVGLAAVVPLLLAPALPGSGKTYCGRAQDMRDAAPHRCRHPPLAQPAAQLHEAGAAAEAGPPVSAFAAAAPLMMGMVNGPLTDLQPAPSMHVLASPDKGCSASIQRRKQPAALMVELDGQLQPATPLRLDVPGTVVVQVHEFT